MGRQKCPSCGSKQWHKEPSSGLIACREGHILQNYRNEMTDVQEIGPHAMKKRAMKIKSEKKGRQSASDPQLYHGARGRFHYLLCLQFILCKQIAVLIRLWDLPAEFEILCKDLWTLHLSMLPKPVPDEVFQEKDPQRKVKVGDGEAANDEKRQDDERTNVDKDEGESEVDSELEALLQENSENSTSSSSSDEGNQAGELANSTKRKGGRNRSSYETPVNTIAVLVVGCWIMRIPVMYRDFNKLIEWYELPYLDPSRWLPNNMARHLTKHNMQGLSPSHAPSTLGLHVAASKLCKRLYSEYGIFVPEVNAASILWRLTKNMGCTPVMYMMAKTVAIDRCVSLGLHSSLAPGVRSVHVSDSVPVEAKLMSALIMVMKMVYGLDGQARGPTCGVPCKKEFLQGLGEMNGDDRTYEMDEYIGFCEGALPGMSTCVFPMRRQEARGGRKRGLLCGDEVHSLLAGEEYKTWDEVEGDEYELVIERARTVLGLEPEYLNGIVRRMDKQR